MGSKWDHGRAAWISHLLAGVCCIMTVTVLPVSARDSEPNSEHVYVNEAVLLVLYQLLHPLSNATHQRRGWKRVLKGSHTSVYVGRASSNCIVPLCESDLVR